MKISQLLTIGGLAVGTAVSPAALAATCNTTPLSTWASGPCTEQDLIYTWIYNTPGNQPTGIDNANAKTFVTPDNPVIGMDTHSIDITSLNGTVVGTYTLRYSVEISAIIAPLGIFNYGWMTSNTSPNDPNGSTTFTSQYFSDAFTTSLGTVTSFNSAQSGNNGNIFGLKKIWIEDTYTYTGTAIINSATDYLTMTVVPEPATLALFGVGLAALGVGACRRKAPAAAA